MKTPHPTFHRIRKLKVVGGFLDRLELTFSDGLVCLIGPRGTGKSTILELMRYGLDALPGKPGDPLRRRAELLIANNLDGGEVELLVETKDGLPYTITRAYDEEPIVKDGAGNSVAMKVRGAAFFAADFFSQNEMETIAETPHYQLGLVDKFRQAELAEAGHQILETVHKLDANKGSLIPLLVKRDQLELEVRELPRLEEQLKGFAVVEGAESQKLNTAHAHKALRDREAKALKLAVEAVDERREEIESLKGALDHDIAEIVDDDLLMGPNKALIRKAVDALGGAAAEADGKLNEAMTLLAEARKRVQVIRNEVKNAHDSQEIEFRKLLEAQKANKARSAERSKLEKMRNDLLFKQKELAETNKRIKSLTAARDKLLDELSGRRDARSGIRLEIADTLNKMTMPQVCVQVHQYGDRTQYREFLTEALSDNNIRHREVSKIIAGAVGPGELGDLIKAGDVNVLMQETGINPNQAETVMRVFDSAHLFDLEAVELDDQPSIQLNDNDQYKDSAELSTGQKCTAILPILLLDSANPLLVDQPEDNLDNRYVYETIVENILRVRDSRQLIFVTHNPNIPVLGEADQVIVMESNGQSACPAKIGNVDECQEEIVTLLEGGKEAFERRRKRYHYQ